MDNHLQKRDTDISNPVSGDTVVLQHSLKRANSARKSTGGSPPLRTLRSYLIPSSGDRAAAERRAVAAEKLRGSGSEGH